MHSTVSLTIPGPASVPLSVETYGDPAQSQTVLLLHGGMQSLRCFHHQFAAFAEHHYVVALDLPYHGRSGVPPASVVPSPALWIESVRAALTHLGRVEKPLVIIAWSFGGLITRSYLLTYGLGSINGLVLVGSLFGGLALYQRCLEPLAAQTIYTMTSPHMTFAERFRAFERWIALLTKQALPPEDADAQYGYNAKAFLQSLSVADHWLQEVPCDEDQFYEHIDVPVLMIQGQDDALVPPAYTQQVASRLRQVQVLSYETCGHAPFLEYPERFTQDVLAFLVAHQADSEQGQAA